MRETKTELNSSTFIYSAIWNPKPESGSKQFH